MFRAHVCSTVGFEPRKSVEWGLDVLSQVDELLFACLLALFTHCNMCVLYNEPIDSPNLLNMNKHKD